MTIPLREGAITVLSRKLMFVEVEKPMLSYSEWITVFPVAVTAVTVPTF